MVEMDGFGAGGGVDGAPNTENLRELGNVTSGLLRLLGFKSCFLLRFSLMGVRFCVVWCCLVL